MIYDNLKSITGLVRSGALKNGFDVEIPFESKNEKIIGKKRIYKIESGLVFLNHLLNDLKEIKSGKKLSEFERDSIERLESIFKENDYKKIFKDDTYNDEYAVKTFNIISKKGKIFKIKVSN